MSDDEEVSDTSRLLANNSGLEDASADLLYPDPWAQAHSFAHDQTLPLAVATETVSPWMQRCAAVLVLVNVMTGPTVLVAPMTFKLGGIMGALVFLIVAALLELLSIYFLLVSSHLGGRGSYRGLFAHYINSALPRLADFLLVLYGMTVIALHMIVVRDELAPLVQQWTGNSSLWATSSNFLTPMYAGLVLLPLLLLGRTVGRLFVPSILAFVTLLVLAGSSAWIFASGPGMSILNPEPVLMFNWSSTLFICVAVFIFSLTPQFLFFPLVSHFGSSVVGRSNALPLVGLACAISCVFYFVVGLFGYLSLPTSVNSNWLLSLDLRQWQAQVAGVAMLLNVSLNFVLWSLCTMDSLEHFILGRGCLSPTFGRVSVGSENVVSPIEGAAVATSINEAAVRERSSSITGSYKGFSFRSWQAFLLAVLGLVIVVGIPTLVVVLIENTDLLVVSSVAGASLCVLVCFLLPSIYYMRAWTAPGCCISVRHTFQVYVLGGCLIAVALAAAASCTYAIVTRQLYIP